MLILPRAVSWPVYTTMLSIVPHQAQPLSNTPHPMRHQPNGISYLARNRILQELRNGASLYLEESVSPSEKRETRESVT